jgi:hypothetical protein
MKNSKQITSRNEHPLINPGKIKIPKEIEVPIYLILHELKQCMIYETINRIASIECYFESHLDRLILASLRMWDGKDETYAVYYKLVDKYSKPINCDHNVLLRRAMKIYDGLVEYRDKMRIKSRKVRF